MAVGKGLAEGMAVDLLPEWIGDRIVVSLADDRVRRNRMKSYLPANGIAAARFFDASAPGSADVRALYDDGKVRRYPSCFRCNRLRCANDACNNVLIPPQVANFASFLRVWQHICETQLITLVMEDDICVHPWFEAGMAWLDAGLAKGRIDFSPDLPRLIRLGWALNDDHEQAGSFQLREITRMSNCMHILTPAYAQKMLERFEGVDTTSDIYLHKNAARPGETMTLFPPLASELSWSTGQIPSRIHPKEKHSVYLRSIGAEKDAQENDRLIATHFKHIYYRPLLITGHPRSGTGYAAGLCQQLGLDVGHENDGQDGVSSWMMAVEADENPWAGHPVAKSRKAFHCDLMIQLVRDPRTAIPSIIRENRHAPKSLAFRRTHILSHTGVDIVENRTEMETACLSLCLWAGIIRLQHPGFVSRLEDKPEILSRFLERSGYPVKKVTRFDTTKINAGKRYQGCVYPKPDLTGADWSGLTIDVVELLDDYCKTYGYARITPMNEDAGRT